MLPSKTQNAASKQKDGNGLLRVHLLVGGQQRDPNVSGVRKDGARSDAWMVYEYHGESAGDFFTVLLVLLLDVEPVR